MHVPHGVLSPAIAVATSVVGAAGFAFGLRRLRPRLRDRTPVFMGMIAAFIFAAQMLNFPLGPLPISGHLLGGVLAAVVLGPWAGSIVLAAVLLVQCFLFLDGGLDALGANYLNMGLLGAVGGYAIYAPIRRAMGGRRGVLVGAMVAAWFSVILAAVAFAVELGASGGWANFWGVLTWIVLVHAAIGLGEALITGLVLRTILLARPDMIEGEDTGTGRRHGVLEAALAGLAIALALAAFVAPFASEHPDGLEKVGEWFGFLPDEPSEPEVPAPIADYKVPGLDQAPKLATALAGVIGTLTVFGVGLGLSRAFTRGPSAPVVGERPEAG